MQKKYRPEQWRLSKKVPKALLITWACRCGIKYSVRANDTDLHLLPARMKCWSPATCRYYLVRKEGKEGPIVRAIELFQAMSGLGAAEERHCTPKDVLKAMIGCKVTGVSLSQTTGERSLIYNITLDSRKTVHLAPSTKGVTVYKVTNE